MGHGKNLYISDLDEAVFGIGDVLDYQVGIDAEERTDRLTVSVATVNSARGEAMENRVRSALLALPTIRTAVADGRLTVSVRTADRPMAVSTGTGKRRIRDLRELEDYP